MPVEEKTSNSAEYKKSVLRLAFATHVSWYVLCGNMGLSQHSDPMFRNFFALRFAHFSRINMGANYAFRPCCAYVGAYSNLSPPTVNVTAVNTVFRIFCPQCSLSGPCWTAA